MKVTIGPYPKKSNKEQKIKVQIDPWDTWSMDITLAHIIVPMLKQLKETKHGAPDVDDDDVPQHLRRTEVPTMAYETDDNYFKRWDYVMDEMIFAFESKLTYWIDQCEDLSSPEVTLRYMRIQNGFELFGKYYHGLWD